MNKQLKKELAAIKSNNEEATKEIRKLLNNKGLTQIT